MTSVLKKKLMGLTGLGICGFITVHMTGNFLLFVSPEAYNKYGHALTSTALIYVAEAGLVTIFLVHIWMAIQLALENRAARPIGYAVSASSDKAASLAARTLIYTGLLIGAFLALHLVTFKYGTVYEVQYGDKTIRDLYRLVEELFQNHLYNATYLAAMAVVGFHMSHTLSASLQSLGLLPANHRLLKPIGVLFAVAIAGGFILQPLYFLIK